MTPGMRMCVEAQETTSDALRRKRVMCEIATLFGLSARRRTYADVNDLRRRIHCVQIFFRQIRRAGRHLIRNAYANQPSRPPRQAMLVHAARASWPAGSVKYFHP